MLNVPISVDLANAETIFLCGAGGGFDVYSGIPLYFYLRAMGKKVILGNYSFAAVDSASQERVGQTGRKITHFTMELPYFPEKYLAEWLYQQKASTDIIAFTQSGVVPLQQTMEKIVRDYAIDTVILVDGGTDSLMKGDETGLGTPVEDSTTMIAVSKLDVARKYLLCLGFGIDHFHGVCHAQFLENVALQIQQGGFKGICSVTIQEEEGQRMMGLVRYANSRCPRHPSIVANSVIGAMEGRYGNYHATNRTRGSQLFINPLMAMYWFFDLKKVTDNIMYKSLIENTTTRQEVKAGIDAFRMSIESKKWENIPL
ncbi:MAG: DUF1152 domain-containing protein [Chitinophagales bacterium]